MTVFCGLFVRINPGFGLLKLLRTRMQLYPLRSLLWCYFASSVQHVRLCECRCYQTWGRAPRLRIWQLEAYFCRGLCQLCEDEGCHYLEPGNQLLLLYVVLATSTLCSADGRNRISRLLCCELDYGPFIKLFRMTSCRRRRVVLQRVRAPVVVSRIIFSFISFGQCQII